MSRLTSHHVGLHVTDLERSRSFYERFVACRLLFQWTPDAPYIRELTGVEYKMHSAVLEMPGTQTALELIEYRGRGASTANSAGAAPATAHLAFYVDDLDSLYREWTLAGINSISQPVTPTIGPNKDGRVVYMLDPDGNRVELIQARGSFSDYAEQQV